jgi:hypothetical protein
MSLEEMIAKRKAVMYMFQPAITLVEDHAGAYMWISISDNNQFSIDSNVQTAGLSCLQFYYS